MPSQRASASVPESDQLESLRQICRRLADTTGGTVLHNLDTTSDIVEALKALTEQASRRHPRQQSGRLRPSGKNDLEQLKLRFMRNVSHEMRTPLACIDGFARALLKMERDATNATAGSEASQSTAETREQFLDIIIQETAHLNSIIEHVLDLSDVEGSRRPHSLELFSARTLFDTVLRGFSHANVRVKLAPEPDRPSIFADRPMICDALQELVANAVKFSGNQEVILGAEQVSIAPSVAGRAADSGVHQRISTGTQIYVKDRGIGIPNEDIQYIFEKFYRVENGVGYRGAGVGLALVWTLVNQNNGKVWATSQPGSGSTFHVLLPNERPDERPVSGF